MLAHLFKDKIFHHKDSKTLENIREIVHVWFYVGEFQGN